VPVGGFANRTIILFPEACSDDLVFNDGRQIFPSGKESPDMTSAAIAVVTGSKIKHLPEE
jgi:hypothetical protein